MEHFSQSNYNHISFDKNFSFFPIYPICGSLFPVANYLFSIL